MSVDCGAVEAELSRAGGSCGIQVGVLVEGWPAVGWSCQCAWVSVRDVHSGRPGCEARPEEWLWIASGVRMQDTGYQGGACAG